MPDFEGWMELCDLYLSQLDYSNACYCMEELIMSKLKFLLKNCWVESSFRIVDSTFLHFLPDAKIRYLLI
jgi:hypothetical protein